MSTVKNDPENCSGGSGQMSVTIPPSSDLGGPSALACGLKSFKDHGQPRELQVSCYSLETNQLIRNPGLLSAGPGLVVLLPAPSTISS